ncbi:hypothetical protein CS542_07070 [Pedobacter sp. IW39]|nr:hypothetical protein CS542_07070 [Pedobacter sp. IW39]
MVTPKKQSKNISEFMPSTNKLSLIYRQRYLPRSSPKSQVLHFVNGLRKDGNFPFQLATSNLKQRKSFHRFILN